jgi:chromosome segregation ATPase
LKRKDELLDAATIDLDNLENQIEEFEAEISLQINEADEMKSNYDELKIKYDTATSQLDRSIKKTKFLEEELKAIKNKELGYARIYYLLFIIICFMF